MSGVREDSERHEFAERMSDKQLEDGYSVQIVKNQILGFYSGIVMLDGERIGSVPLLGGACLRREGVIAAAERFAAVHHENSQPPVSLDVSGARREQPS